MKWKAKRSSWRVTVNKCLLTSFLLLFFGSPGTAQHKEKQSLENILTRLEERFAVVFTYADHNVSGVSLSPPSETFDLAETLRYLHENTGLRFQQLTERFVTISKDPPESTNICGLLIYSDTGETVEGASIQCGEIFSVTNDNGYFYLNTLKTDTLQIRFIGYSTMEIYVSGFLQHPCKKVKM